MPFVQVYDDNWGVTLEICYQKTYAIGHFFSCHSSYLEAERILVRHVDHCQCALLFGEQAARAG